MKIELPKEALTLEQARQLRNSRERDFAIAACLSPYLLVYHEPFMVTNRQGKTLPDFLVINTRQPHPKYNFFEVTGTKAATGNRKIKQRRVMTVEVKESDNVRYFQLVRADMDKIARRAAQDEVR